jgi:rod shape-determining protein MreB
MFLGSVLSLFSNDLAIDLGTANTLIYARGRGIVLNEPSVLAVRKTDKGKDKILAVGRQAKTMLGRTPGDIVAMRPVADGVIADLDTTGTMLRYFIRKVRNRRSLVRPRIIIAVPSGVTQVERKAIRESAEPGGAKEIFLIKEPMAAAIGADLPITKPTSNIIVDIGAGTTEVAVISMAGMVYAGSVRVGGNKMDEAIVQHIKRRYNLLIGLQTAELIKVSIGTAYPVDEPERTEVKGRDLVTGIPRIVTIDSEEVRGAISEKLDTIAQTVRIALEQTPPELSADLIDKGLVLTGGGALLKGLDVMLGEETRLPVTVTDDPHTTVVLGAGKVLENPLLLREIAAT